MKHILFLCTDNYTRSITAEFCLRDYMQKHNLPLTVAAAGFKADSDVSRFSDIHFKRMAELGIDTSAFTRTPFSEDMLDKYDVVVAMGREHQDYIKTQYNRSVPLFYEIYKNESQSVTVPPPDSAGTYLKSIERMVDEIYEAMPVLVRNL
ncbi:hypothetical protein P6P90_12300 [Ectobacillus antri]|jgi:protein-tyrosine phosphatase|uniref:Phosphotyrosine protein phosphatase I domain-containing protein n=1 Tax=Ectobacillus antri TaxID=2486280 RepID=A0ABT6H6S4_9BACI|nr:hypothetical protein [Ectobacillus antri]MDG4657743.1 hypothetical protein [Ectobacillus antri]MDG5754750.1 hypothetical protein [Ectobacillus antri]